MTRANETIESLLQRLHQARATYPKMRKLADAATRLEGEMDTEAMSERLNEAKDLVASCLGSSHPLARDFAEFTVLYKKNSAGSSNGAQAGKQGPKNQGGMGGFSGFSTRTPPLPASAHKGSFNAAPSSAPSAPAPLPDVLPDVLPSVLPNMSPNMSSKTSKAGPVLAPLPWPQPTSHIPDPSKVEQPRDLPDASAADASPLLAESSSPATAPDPSLDEFMPDNNFDISASLDPRPQVPEEEPELPEIFMATLRSDVARQPSIKVLEEDENKDNFILFNSEKIAEEPQPLPAPEFFALEVASEISPALPVSPAPSPPAKLAKPAQFNNPPAAAFSSSSSSPAPRPRLAEPLSRPAAPSKPRSEEAREAPPAELDQLDALLDSLLN